MKRRDFLAGLGAAGSASLAGCLDEIVGSDDDSDEIVGRHQDDKEHDNRPGDSVSVVGLEFTGNTETLGHVADNNPGDYDGRPIEYEIERTESEWQELRENDLQNAEEQLDEIDRRDDVSSIEDMRPFIEQALEESPEDQPDERAIIDTVGDYTNHEVILPRVSEHFAQEYLDDSNLRMWWVGVTNPATDGTFTLRNFAASYRHEGETVNDWVDIGHIPDAQEVRNEDNRDLIPGGVDVRDPEETIYAQDEELEWNGAYQFEKMMEAAEQGLIEQEEAFNPTHPMHAISNNILLHTRDMVDPALDDYELERIPPNGLLTAITPEFGRSVEEAFYDNWSEDKRQKMENLGRAVFRFYEEEDAEGYLGVDGTLDEPELYAFRTADGIERAWDAALEQDSLDFTELEYE